LDPGLCSFLGMEGASLKKCTTSIFVLHEMLLIMTETFLVPTFKMILCNYSCNIVVECVFLSITTVTFVSRLIAGRR